MRVRTYKVAHNRDTETREILRYFITDVHDDAELQKGQRPDIATFPVSQLYDMEEQKAVPITIVST